MKSFALLLCATLAIANVLRHDLMKDEDLGLEEAVAPTGAVYEALTGVFDSMMGRKALRVQRRGTNRRRWEHDDADAKTEFCWEGICIPVCTGGNRRMTEEEQLLQDEKFRLCYSIGDQVTTMISQALHLLLAPGSSNDGEIARMMATVFQMCEDQGANDFAITQCKAYVGLVIRIYEQEGSAYLANQMLVASFGDEMSKKEGCGVVVNMINAKIKAGKIPGLSTTPLLSRDSPWPSAEYPDVELEVVVADNASHLFSPVGAAVGFMVTVVGTVSHYAFEMCHDYYMIDTI